MIDEYVYSTDALQLICVFAGTPGTIQWYLNEHSIPNSSDSYNIDYHIVNSTTLTFVGVLLNQEMTLLELLGDYKCEFATSIIMENSGWNSECKDNYSFFICKI